MSSQDSLNIPISTSSVKVSIIDTTFDANLPTSYFFGPINKGFETFRAIAYAFLITHTDAEGKKRNIVFDLGAPKDLETDFPPPERESIRPMFEKNVTVKKYVSEILVEGGVQLEDIEAVIWSHAHPDHVGRASLFPTTTTLIVGPDVKTAYYPGWPANPDSPVLEREFDGRKVTEINFTASELNIGGFKALDFFGDGSFYLLSAPGHALGHLNALARTTESTLIYLGADSFHHASMIRPHSDFPLPENIDLSSLRYSCQAFRAIHPLENLAKIPEQYHSTFERYDKGYRKSPFHTISKTDAGQSVAVDIDEARNTIEKIQRFDREDNVFIIAAHDTSLYNILDYFPKEANEWREKGWKEKGKWLFLHDLRAALELVRAPTTSE